MKIIYRYKDNKDYWENRWEKAGADSDSFQNMDIYPIKYAEMVMKNAQHTLEAGCGSGRVLFHYLNQGKKIKGVDFSEVAIKNIQKNHPQADVQVADITDLPFQDNTFDRILAFGLYHNLFEEQQIKKAFAQTARVLQKGGKLLASVRFDSFENRYIESIVSKRSSQKGEKKPHRVHFTLQDIQTILPEQGLKIETILYVRNVSFLFKFDFFRSKEMKKAIFVEQKARSQGFRLNGLGRLIDTTLHTLFPKMFSNLMVIVATKQ